MRSPRRLAVAVRAPDGGIVVDNQEFLAYSRRVQDPGLPDPARRRLPVRIPRHRHQGPELLHGRSRTARCTGTARCRSNAEAAAVAARRAPLRQGPGASTPSWWASACLASLRSGPGAVPAAALLGRLQPRSAAPRTPRQIPSCSTSPPAGAHHPAARLHVGHFPSQGHRPGLPVPRRRAQEHLRP